MTALFVVFSMVSVRFMNLSSQVEGREYGSTVRPVHLLTTLADVPLPVLVLHLAYRGLGSVGWLEDEIGVMLKLSDQQRRYLISVVFGVGILGGALWYVVTNAPAAVAAAVIAASATVLVSVFGTLASKHLERKQELEKEHRERKLEVYKQFMDYQFATMQGVRSGMNAAKRREFDRAFRESFPQNLISWGSEDIIKSTETG